MTMQTADLAQLKQDAIDKIIFHATPRAWLRPTRPLGARPRRGSAALRRGRPRIPRRALGWRLRGARRVRSRGDRAGDVRAGPAAALHEPVRDDECRHGRAGTQARRADTRRPGRQLLLQQRVGGGRSGDQARPPVPRGERRGPPLQGRLAATCLSRLDPRRPVGDGLEPGLRRLPSQRRSDGAGGRVHERHAALLLPLRARVDVSGLRPRLRHDDRAGDPGQRSGARVLRHPRAGHGHGRLHRPAARATWPRSARSATATASCSSPTRWSAASAGRGAGSGSTTSTWSPTSWSSPRASPAATRRWRPPSPGARSPRRSRSSSTSTRTADIRCRPRRRSPTSGSSSASTSSRTPRRSGAT